MGRKTRSINKSKNDTKKIMECHNNGMSAMEIVRHFEGKYTYWQVYNTISPRDVNKNSKGDIELNDVNEMNTENPPIDLSDFSSVEKYLEHQLSILIAQLNQKRMSLNNRTFLLKQLTEINKKLKAQSLENYLKSGTAKLIIRIMRRLKPDLTDEEILKIYKEESEKLKNAK